MFRLKKSLHVTSMMILCVNFIKTVNSKEVNFVVDTTFSMTDEISTIQNNVGKFLDSLKNSEGAKVDSFIVVPFNYPDVQTTSATKYPEEFASVLSGLVAAGGASCEENTLGAVHRALELSQDNSDIFVFTDAYAKAYVDTDGLTALCSAKKSRVTVFLTGMCVAGGGGGGGGEGGAEGGRGDGFAALRPACGGMLYNMRSAQLKQAFDVMTELLTGDWTAVADRGVFNGRSQHTFISTPTSNGVLIAMSGDYPTLESVFGADNATVETRKIAETKNMLVVLAPNLRPGNYSIRTNGQGAFRVALYTKQRFPFEIGFSPQLPRDLRETSSRPLPVRNSYIMLKASSTLNVELTTLKIRNMMDPLYDAEESLQRYGDHYWLAKFYFQPDTDYVITVIGIYEETSEHFEETSKTIKTQELVQSSTPLPWTIPTAEILDSNLTVDYGSGGRLACLVRGYPEPRVNWDGGNMTPQDRFLLEIPSTYLSYLDIRPEADTTYTCRAENARGVAMHQTRVAVRRTKFLKVTPPQNTTIPYESQGSLTCAVQSYPKATIKWYHNETEVEHSSSVRLEGDTLIIVRMSIDDVGNYTCEVTNGEETQTFTTRVDISEIEPPAIENAVGEEIVLKLGDRHRIECRVTEGKPVPTVKWTWKRLDDTFAPFSKLPADVTASGSYLDVPSARLEHSGVYRCEAVNPFGSDHWDGVVRVRYAPAIADTDETRIEVREGAPVELACVARGDPAPAVRWRRERRGRPMAMDERIRVDEQHTLSFFAEWSDSGEYLCTAENELGVAEKNVTVDVHVAPYLEPASPRDVRPRAGAAVTLPCAAAAGSPAPALHWRFVPAADPRRAVTLAEGVGMSLPYQLTSVGAEHSGTYMCIASNNIGTDNIKYTVKVES